MSSPERALRDRIAAVGPLPFAEVMREALYGEDGYYRRDVSPIGKGGDYVTGSSLSPLFGRSTASMLLRLDACLERPADYLEVGYGDGKHLESLLEGLPRSAGRRILAFDRVSKELPRAVTRLDELGSPQLDPVSGMIFSYELFDALPVNRLIGRSDGSIGELWVDLDSSGKFQYVERGLSDPALLAAFDEVGRVLQPGQIADVALGWAPLYRQMAELLEVGILVTCDYGFERRRLFDTRVRMHGTLACYRQQRVHRDALRDLGKQDLTAHVDFTTLREVGEEVGLETIAWTRQARWLVACGLFDQIQSETRSGRLEAMDLLHPEGMGEEIRVLVQGRGIDAHALLDLDLLGG